MNINIGELLQDLFRDLRDANPHVPQHKFDLMQQTIAKRVDREPPPNIALVGETGVGKSTTINALFNAGQGVGHTKAHTMGETAIQVTVEAVNGQQGLLEVYDMPGLGESKAKRATHFETYKRVLEKVDVAVWILDAQYRAIESIQEYLANEISSINPNLIQRMVFALNKADLVHPGPMHWHPYANLPSEEQEENIKERILDVKAKISEAVPAWNGTVIAYSALKRYNLPQLFEVMLEAVPMKRRWVVASRKALADFLELVDPRLLPEDKRPVRPAPPNAPKRKTVEELIQEMTPEEFAQLKSRDDLLNWVERKIDNK
jgi:small GTP-binding protein